MKQNFSPPLQGRSNGDTAMRSAHLCHCRASKFFLSTHRGLQKLAGKGEMNPIEGKISRDEDSSEAPAAEGCWNDGCLQCHLWMELCRQKSFARSPN